MAIGAGAGREGVSALVPRRKIGSGSSARPGPTGSPGWPRMMPSPIGQSARRAASEPTRAAVIMSPMPGYAPPQGDARCRVEATDADHPREACGVLGLLSPGQPAAPLIADGMHALQHRGQEAAGLAVSDEERITVIKDVGLVTDVLDRRTIGGLAGELGIGHTRYSTTGSSTWENAQP